MPDIEKIDQNGEQSIGIVKDNAIGIFSPTYFINPDLNKLPFEIPENGIFFYSYRFPILHSFFKNRIIYYFFIIAVSMILILPLLKFQYHQEDIIIFSFFLSYIFLVFFQDFTQKNILRKEAIILTGKNPVFFHDIRKIKKEDLNLKVYFRTEVYPKYVISLKNEDQADAILECFENWLLTR